MAKKTPGMSATGSRPTSNRTGLNSAKLSPGNIRGMSAAQPASVIATGRGTKAAGPRQMKRRTRRGR